MRPRLMFPDADFAPETAGPGDLVGDLVLEELWAGMARGDGRLNALARAATLAPLTTRPPSSTGRRCSATACATPRPSGRSTGWPTRR